MLTEKRKKIQIEKLCRKKSSAKLRRVCRITPNICNGTFVAEIVNSQKPLAILKTPS